MSDLPTLIKSYAGNFTKINQGFTTTGNLNTDGQIVCLAMKNSLIGLAHTPWTVLGSSNGSAFGLDAVDRWSTSGNLVFTGSGNHAWIVLKQSGANNIQMCIDMHYFQGWQADFVVSFAGFTGGSLSARPTATDETTLGGGAIFAPSGSPQNFRLHVWGSTDGSCTYIVGYTQNVQQFFLYLNPAQNVPTALTWPNPTWGGVQWGASALRYSNIGQNAFSHGLLGNASLAWVGFYMTSEAVSGNAVPAWQTYPDDDTGEYPFTPIGLFTLTTSHRGRKGTSTDLWWGLANNNSGDNYPASGTLYQFAQFGDIIFPWDGATPPTTA